MSTLRKIKRERQIKALKDLGIIHCGQVMQCKENYDDHGNDLWICEKCGNVKSIPHDYNEKARSLITRKG